MMDVQRAVLLSLTSNVNTTAQMLETTVALFTSLLLLLILVLMLLPPKLPLHSMIP